MPQSFTCRITQHSIIGLYILILPKTKIIPTYTVQKAPSNVKSYPRADNITHALHVMLVTNIMSDGVQRKVGWSWGLKLYIFQVWGLPQSREPGTYLHKHGKKLLFVEKKEVCKRETTNACCKVELGGMTCVLFLFSLKLSNLSTRFFSLFVFTS